MSENSGVLDILIFWAVLFLTCLVGLIEFIPELVHWNDYKKHKYNNIFKLSMSLLYFGLLFGVIFSLFKFFNLYGLGYYGSPTLDWVQEYFYTYWFLFLVLILILLFIFIVYFLFRIKSNININNRHTATIDEVKGKHVDDLSRVRVIENKSPNKNGEKNATQDNNNGESPIKILISLYSVIAGLASVTAVKFLVGSNNAEIRNPFSIPLIDILSFLSFFCFIIPFYQGAITYLHDTYNSNYHGKKIDILVDFLHLLAEGMIFYAISASLVDILLFLSWLFILLVIDSLWIASIVLRGRTPSPEIKRTRTVWVKLNLGSFIFLLFMWILYTTNPNVVIGIQGYAILFFFSLLRTLFDYVLTKSFYFG